MLRRLPTGESSLYSATAAHLKFSLSKCILLGRCTYVVLCNSSLGKWRFARLRDLTGSLGIAHESTFVKINIFRFFVCLQKARLARIRIAKASSGAAFVSKKKAAEARLAALESGLAPDDSYREEDIFELQHHHLLRCLEKTTVSSCILIIEIFYSSETLFD